MCEQSNDTTQPATVADILITEELTRRTPRPPDHKAENRALHAFAAYMAEQPEHLLQHLATTALSLCGATSAGVRLVETGASGEALLRWAALAGTHATQRGRVTPLENSPSEACMARRAPQLCRQPGRLYQSLAALQPPITEALVMPFPDGSRHRGTIWVMAHDGHHFDAEDVRAVTALAEFTVAAVHHADAVRNQEVRQARETRLTTELQALEELHRLTNQLLAAPNLQTALDVLLDATLALHDTTMGTLLLYSDTASGLTPLVHRGFDAASDVIPAVIDDNFDSSCGQALRSRQRVVIEDYETDPTSQSHRGTARAFGYRASQSTPLITSDGQLLGMLSTQFSQPHRPSDHELQMTDLYARQATQLIELHRSADSMREADRRKDEFMAVLAHELRDPLAPIQNALQALRWGEADRDPIRSIPALLERQVEHLVRLVDDLVDVSRISRGQVVLRRERTNLTSIIRQATEAARPSCETKQIEFTVAPSAQPLIVNGDAARLIQVIGNLLSNACKFTGTGGHIELQVESQADQAVIRIRDTGIGIAPDLFPRIFEMFGQADTVRERAHGGLGIGLTLARELVELHDGTLTVASAGPGQGSEFVVRLPLDSDPQPISAPERRGAAPSATRHRILIVDDNPDSLDSLGLLLDIIGHEVHAAADGLEAVEAAAAFRPELILLDIGLPRLDGLAACRRIRSEPWGQTMVIAALSGWGTEDDRRRSAAAGFDAHLTKPLADADLMALLDDLPVAGNTETSR